MADKPIPEMVKRVARALHAKLVSEDDAGAYAQGDYPCLTLDGVFDCEEIVQTVIEAMREPTEAIRNADRAVYGTEYFPLRPSEWSMDAVWRAGIDAALGKHD